jgi:hypothetical protein
VTSKKRFEAPFSLEQKNIFSLPSSVMRVPLVELFLNVLPASVSLPSVHVDDHVRLRLGRTSHERTLDGVTALIVGQSLAALAGTVQQGLLGAATGVGHLRQGSGQSIHTY